MFLTCIKKFKLFDLSTPERVSHTGNCSNLPLSTRVDPFSLWPEHDDFLKALPDKPHCISPPLSGHKMPLIGPAAKGVVNCRPLQPADRGYIFPTDMKWVDERRSC